MRQWSHRDYHSMPWKNGGGSTTELAIFPQGADLDHFIWRLSTAQVNTDGPFSHFPQIDRTLAILSDEGLLLHTDIASAPATSIGLTRASAPYRFSGELPVHAELIGGPVLDLNMMSRRDVCTHYMQRLEGGSHVIDARDAQQVLLFCATGSAILTSGQTMQANDLYLFDEEHSHSGISLELQANDDAVCYLIRIQFLTMGEP